MDSPRNSLSWQVISVNFYWLWCKFKPKYAFPRPLPHTLTLFTLSEMVDNIVGATIFTLSRIVERPVGVTIFTLSFSFE